MICKKEFIKIAHLDRDGHFGHRKAYILENDAQGLSRKGRKTRDELWRFLLNGPKAACLSLTTHGYPSFQIHFMNGKRYLTKVTDAWVHLEISDQSVQLFKKELSTLNASPLWILSFWMELICKKRLSVVFILFVWRYINGPVKLLSLETWPIVDFFSVTGINNGCNQFKFKLWNYPCYYSKHQHQRAGLWFISVLQKWDAVHNNIQGRRK